MIAVLFEVPPLPAEAARRCEIAAALRDGLRRDRAEGPAKSTAVVR